MKKYPKEKVDAIVYYDMGITIQHLAEYLDLTVEEVMAIYDYVIDHRLLKYFGKTDGGYKLKYDYLEEYKILREMNDYED